MLHVQERFRPLSRHTLYHLFSICRNSKRQESVSLSCAFQSYAPRGNFLDPFWKDQAV